MKFFEKMKQKKADNKGFSLVELIIVIAIMAILVGIVGTQVIPYLNKSKEAKDIQLLNSYSTAAVTAYSSNVADITATSGKITVLVYGTNTEADALLLKPEIQELVGYSTLTALTDKMGSDTGKDTTEVTIEIDLDNKTVTATATGSTLDPVVSDL